MNSSSSSSSTVQAKSLLQVQDGGPLILLSYTVFPPMSENRKQESFKKLNERRCRQEKKSPQNPCYFYWSKSMHGTVHCPKSQS